MLVRCFLVGFHLVVTFAYTKLSKDLIALAVRDAHKASSLMETAVYAPQSESLKFSFNVRFRFQLFCFREMLKAHACIRMW